MAEAEARYWDWPVRLIHIGFITLLPAMWWTYREGEMDWHIRLGLVMLGLVLFRFLWGLFGSQTARFSQFLAGPGTIIGYLRDGRWHGVGHNPLGGWSVLAILLALLTQTLLGLFTSDTDGLVYGPLSHLVSYEQSATAGQWHERIFNLILALVALHVSAIAIHLMLLGSNLVTPMITGRKALEGEGGTEPASPPRMAPAWLPLLLAPPVAALVWWIGKGAPLPGA